MECQHISIPKIVKNIISEALIYESLNENRKMLYLHSINFDCENFCLSASFKSDEHEVNRAARQPDKQENCYRNFLKAIIY